MIRIHLTGDPGFRSGTLTIGDESWQLATWHREGDGVYVATTRDGQRVRYTQGADHYCLDVAGRFWRVTGRWRQTVFDGEANPSDVWLDGYLQRLAERVRG